MTAPEKPKTDRKTCENCGTVREPINPDYVGTGEILQIIFWGMPAFAAFTCISLLIPPEIMGKETRAISTAVYRSRNRQQANNFSTLYPYNRMQDLSRSNMGLKIKERCQACSTRETDRQAAIKEQVRNLNQTTNPGYLHGVVEIAADIMETMSPERGQEFLDKFENPVRQWIVEEIRRRNPETS